MNLDATALVAVTATSLLVSVLLYVWIAIALSAVFRKSGEAAWKAWVPLYNIGVLFQLGGYPWWSVLLVLIPVAGAVIVLVVFILAAHRVNRAFGYGAGMTVLALVLAPVWATVLGFGSARWIGAEGADAAVRRRSSADAEADPAYARGFDGTPASFGREQQPAATELAGWAPTRSPQPGPARAVGPEDEPAATDVDEPVEAAPRSPFADWWPDVIDEDPDTDSAVDDPISGPLIDDDPALGAPRAAAATEAPGAPGSAETPTRDPHPADVPPLGAPAASEDEEVPPPLRRSTARPAWNGFDLSVAGELTGEVTDAVPGAPAPISAVPTAGSAPEPRTEYAEQAEAPSGDDPAHGQPHPEVPDAAGDQTPPSIGAPPTPPARPTPPVTRAPAPWADASASASGPAEAGAFPDDGEVSAIVGAPIAGEPRAARSSVSSRFADVSRDDELADHTVIARRRRTGWVLVGPDGERIPLTEDVAIVGRRPSVDSAFPHAQLVTVGDPTRTVSKTHARLELRGDVWAVVDLDSTNGVVLVADNDDETEVQPGAVTRLTPRFYLGDAELRLEEAAAP